MNTPNVSNVSNQDQFPEFLYKEYDNIAAAHFKTTELISEYFKHYLTIVTIPFTLLVVIVNLDIFKTALINGTLSKIFIVPVALLFIILSFIGVMFFWYILNLRWDALLYARTINGIRKYFFDHDLTLDIANRYRQRVLPQSPFIPGYREFQFFGPLVLTFGVLNSLYFYISLIAFEFVLGNSFPFSSLFVIISTSLFFTFHIFWYLFLAQRRELSYLQSNILGVDIDGVLNLHRNQFSEFLKINTGKEIDPEKITVIPVRDCPELGLDLADEFAVFNDPNYWTTMKPAPRAAEVLRRLRNSMRLKIHIFTSRPWPNLDKSMKSQQKKALKTTWKRTSKTYRASVNKKRTFWSKIKSPFVEISRIFPYRIRRLRSLLRHDNPMEMITKAWLLDNNFEYDRLMVEMGSEEVADPAAHIHNRFYASRILTIKYFIEDDLIKAEKLSYVCDIVFLIDQPYNQKSKLPGNIIRVKNWGEILLQMRQLS